MLEHENDGELVQALRHGIVMMIGRKGHIARYRREHVRLPRDASKMVIPTGFEPVTPRLGIWCSILLSYGTANADINGSIGLANRFGDIHARLAAVSAMRIQ